MWVVCVCVCGWVSGYGGRGVVGQTTRIVMAGEESTVSAQTI